MISVACVRAPLPASLDVSFCRPTRTDNNSIQKFAFIHQVESHFVSFSSSTQRHTQKKIATTTRVRYNIASEGKHHAVLPYWMEKMKLILLL